MSGQKIGYIRVSTVEQNEARQLLGLQLDKSFIDIRGQLALPVMTS